MADAAVRLQDVHKRYRVYRQKYSSLKEILLHRRFGEWEDRWALRGVSLDVERGAMFGLVGPNGAGKSTALKLMARILTPDRGRLEMAGRVAALIELGSGFLLEYTGRENVYLNASLLGLSRREIDERFDAILDFSELRDHIDAPLRTYSSGMSMRLAFSIAINTRPQIMLIDEVLAVGDEAFQRKCFKWIDGFLADGGTIVLVSHGLDAIREFCSAAAWIEQGSIQAIGTAHDVVSAYTDHVREQQRAEEQALVEQGRAVGRSVEIEEIRVLDSNGRAVEKLEPGEPLQVEVAYRVTRDVEAIAIGVGLHRNDGVYVYGTNNLLDGVEVPSAPGPARVRLVYPALSVLPGTYDLMVAAVDSRRTTAPAVDTRWLRPAFQVDVATHEQGSVRLEHAWEIVGGAPAKRRLASGGRR